MSAFPRTSMDDVASYVSQPSHAKRMLRKYVKRALVLRRDEGQDALYQELLARLVGLCQKVQDHHAVSDQKQECASKDEESKKMDQDGLLRLLEAMAYAVEDVDEEKHRSLLQAVAKVSCWKVPMKVAHAHTHLIVELAAYQSNLVPFALQILVSNFVPPLESTWKETIPQDGMDLGLGEAWVPQPEGFRVLEHILNTVHEIVEMDPSAITSIMPMLNHQFPHPEQNRDAHCYYLCAIMQLAESSVGAPIRTRILAALLENILQMEFHMDWKVFEKEDEDWEPEDVHVHRQGEQDGPQDELAGPVSSWKILAGSGEDGSDDAHLRDSRDTFDQKRSAFVTADKLDSVMELLFAHLLRQFQAGHLEELLQVIMLSMKHTVLPTRCSRIVHFVVFLLGCHAPTRTCEYFIDMLLKCMLDEGATTDMRLSCACYLASFLGRAAFMPTVQLVGVLARLCQWCLEYLENLEKERPHSSRLEVDDHLVFYSCCHCILYPLCFKMKVLLNGTEGNNLIALPLQKVLKSTLCPLQVCLPTVVDEFVSQATILDMLHLLPSDFEIQDPMGEKLEHALNFFPFDHYVLGRSASFLQLDKTHMHWQKS